MPALVAATIQIIRRYQRDQQSLALAQRISNDCYWHARKRPA